MTGERVGARERLLAFPEWFTQTTAAGLLQITPEATTVYLSRWKQAGLIESFGRRTGVYFNRVRCPESIEHLRIPALRYLYPDATLIGDSVLHAHGWITQIPSALHVAILPKPTTVSPDGVRIETRSEAWFRALGKHLIPANKGTAGLGLREISPAAALADLRLHGREPDPDDLYLEDEDWEAVRELADTLRKPLRMGKGAKAAQGMGF